ncbi:RNA polymerase sigma-70 factor (ECF subfamily) [Roseovarius halotolerans]|uniref:RNA polymerase sigma factor n=2 Tax=Roseovarius halotolerans TaxID=505353 RepID=A0A1X6YC02_9RHOB|nr:RNA polymerase sigma-70 factor (ECF subfamily) [Roseovarius halotolerans]SLN14978.1 ECF RNA polymerase sigma factor RpoE [Roseovarius halotolerans]
MHLRIAVMLMLDLDTSRAGPIVPVMPSEEGKKVSQENTELSQQTVWMLAVRDNRDSEAFAALFDFFAPRLKAFIMRSGLSAHQSEEIVQDVMLTVWRKAAMFDPHRAQVSAWIYQIARNRQIDILRRERRPMPEELHEEPGSEADASQILALEQEARRLKAALGQLRPDQREIIEKAYMGELTHQEISQQTGLPLGTIKSRIRLGLDRLRHELRELKS